MDQLTSTSLSETVTSKTKQFLADVTAGLSTSPKRLSSKYFYDANGDKIFQELMNCPEYYPTDCELEIFSQKTEQLAAAITSDDTPFDLIELGAGDASKSAYLLKYLLDQKKTFTYMPIDISDNVISYLNITLPVTLPGIDINGLNGEYFEMLAKAANISSRRKVVMFLGSNIGNMPVKDAKVFCRELRNHLSPGDKLLIGIDLQKAPKTILAAYNDSEGITKKFNINLLHRINRELNGNFKPDQFDHYAMYDPESGACKSYLISLTEQTVNVGAQKFHFKRDEYIYMEISQKFTVKQTEEMALEAGFTPVQELLDSKNWFMDAVWEA